MEKQVVIDIDGILWSIRDPWHEELIKINPDCPYPGNTTWNFYEEYMSWEDAYKAATEVHKSQLEYSPFTRAPELVNLFYNNGYRVVIASHRSASTYDVTKKWLLVNNIQHHELYTGKDKHPYLEDSRTVLFIDDAPASQEIAVSLNIPVMSIKYPYNKHVYSVMFYEDMDCLVNGAKAWVLAHGSDTGLFGTLQASVSIKISDGV